MPQGEQQPITLADVRHVARLARLSLSDEQLAQLLPQLESILGYVQQIRSANVEGIEPMSHVAQLSNVLREDVAGPGLAVEAVLANAPATDPPFFKVPKVIADEDSAG
jgi:aspartyl-tRNA(Asn)/glutamyl-tRNA(Gln) amidotransferase subunit C